ncbi:heavy metal translocating P-type ATPase [Aneurinibacillus sp. REN35]|uniref:heavy metal translocating P-type ATPase n=1 Tax=Aneurinibacillus sp. REN35 TaxID=3237286 RepID=UPI00352746A7
MTEHAQAKHTYRVQGFTCAGCAAQFERKVKELPGVTDAKVNFGAAKIAVEGEVTLEQLEQAGSFENLRLVPEAQRMVLAREPFWKKPSNIRTAIAAVLLVIAWAVSGKYGEGSWLPVLLYGTSILIGGYTLFIKGLRNLFALQFDMNTLMTIAIIGAAAIGEWGEGAMVVFLFAISEALESYSMDKARRSITSLMDAAPKEATVRRNGKDIQVSVDDILIGDLMIVKPGEKLAMDGEVVRGISSVNQAPITGESIPVAKTVGDEVFAGTLNEEGLLEVKVTKAAEDTTLAKIFHLVEEAQAERAPSQAFVDRFAKYYTPAIMLFAFGVAVVPPLLFGGAWDVWIYEGLAVLVVGCPCALVVSTPVAIVTAIGSAARNGVLIKGGVHLEEAGSLSVMAFDKTGTLTRGIPAVTDMIALQGEQHKEDELVAIAAAMETGSKHPLASAIVRKATEMRCSFERLDVAAFSSVTGKGITAKINEVVYYMGSPRWFVELLPAAKMKDVQPIVDALQKQGKTVMILGTAEQALLLIAAADEVRASSKEALRKLHAMGIKKTIMLTGDNQATAEVIGTELGIHEVQAELLPQDKLAVIKQMKASGEKVAMIGDGVNDAPALAAATVGIAMGGAGTDTALETADIALMADDVEKLPFTIKLSRRALAIIKQNITFALGIKLAALILVVPGWLTLWIAIFADMGATLLVTVNALRLLRVKE